MKLKMNVARAYKSPYEAEPTPCTLLCVSARYTPEAGLYVERGDIKDGVFYPCKPDIFAKTYESATLTPPNEWVSVEEMEMLEGIENGTVPCDNA